MHQSTTSAWENPLLIEPERENDEKLPAMLECLQVHCYHFQHLVTRRCQKIVLLVSTCGGVPHFANCAVFEALGAAFSRPGPRIAKYRLAD
jgi:hypothetical protein